MPLPQLLALVHWLLTGTAGFTQATIPHTLLASPYQWEFLIGCGVSALAGYRLPGLLALRSQSPVLVALVLLAAVLLLWPFPATPVFRLVLLVVLGLLILLSSMSDIQFPGLRCLAGVGAISFSPYLTHNPLESLLVRLALRFHQPEAVAAALLVLIPLLASVAYFRTFESWSLNVMQCAASWLQSTY